MNKDRLKLVSLAVLASMSCQAVNTIINPPSSRAIEPGTTSTTSPTPTLLEDYLANPTNTPTPGSPESLWIGQAELNELREGRQDAEAFKLYLGQVADATDAMNADSPANRTDSAQTALTNEFTGPQFDAVSDPTRETGMELTGAEIRQIRDEGHILTVLNESPTLDSLMRPLSNDPNLLVAGVWGAGDDLDAMTASLASGLWYQLSEFNGGSVDGQTTLRNVVSLGDVAIQNQVAAIQDQIRSQFVDSDLPVSETEQKARRDWGGDASAQISPLLRTTDQFETCEEGRGYPINGSRDSQPQVWFPVSHIDDGAETVTEANVSNEHIALVMVFDKSTGQWDVVAVTSRGFTNDPHQGDVSEAVSGNELLVCGPGAADPTATGAPHIGATRTPGAPTTEGSTPTFGVPTVTEAPTQPRQTQLPTARPGDTQIPTPIVPTPMDTPVPTEIVSPNPPPTNEPIPTPIFPDDTPTP